MNPTVPLLDDALKHDAVNFADFCEKEIDFPECVDSLPKMRQSLLVTLDGAHLI